ncbi:nitrate reductase molybdenum cofactor assembly chaperone [Agromyces archimandritae]|uniref:Nitrate reductase molybdenum cofactor assembly chaperone n=1 Tax=Agromyces archimandritae TaxID=2781962 RepID=A0A975IN47_9MICO|nr:nitrate reductase molybdenum cofactor assembly chaperone [Agromyces archimandritae]QTX03859.1 nitrate reductase molybdenum cofactor assembly chaperone [Agromyces archimandritae]
MRLPRQIRFSRPPARIAPVRIDEQARRSLHMVLSLLLDYPGEALDDGRVRTAASSLPEPFGEAVREFLSRVDAMARPELEDHYVRTFDLKRKCSMYLSYYATGDTRRRGTALIAFLDAYRAAGWEFDAAELPDYLPAVLEFSALSDSPIAAELIAAHREGIEVLREALDRLGSPYAGLVGALCRSLPELDEATLERYRTLIEEGPPAETVGLPFPQLAPYGGGSTAPLGAAAGPAGTAPFGTASFGTAPFGSETAP